MRIKIDNKIKSVIDRDKKVILTTTREHFPFVAERGSGDYAYDISGNRFIDFSSFVCVYNLGVNANARVRSAVKEQVDKLMHPAFLDFYSELPVRFAEKLIKMFPKGFGRVFYSNSGTEANEDAIKLSKIFTKRTQIIAFYNAFHGRSTGSLSLTATKAIYRAHYGPFVGVVHAPYPNPYRYYFHSDDPAEYAKDCLDYMEKNLLAQKVPPEEVAAIFIEPIQGEGGYIVPPKEFFKGLREMADRYGMLLVDDEIQAGYMRTGKFLALDNFGVTADIYTMAKALGGGLPLAATISKTSLGNVPAGSHAGTFGGNLVSVAAANASLDYVRENLHSLQRSIIRKGRYVMKRLEEMKDTYEIVGDVRGIGLMIGVEFVKDKRTKEPAVKERDRVVDECFYNGLIILPCGVSTLRITPPLTISDRNLEKGMDVFEEAVKNVNAGSSSAT